jgi:hypothetical protein
MIVRRSGFGRTLPLPVLLLVSTLAFLHAPLSAQIRRDSVADTTRRPSQDSLKVIADSLKPPPILVKHPARGAASFGLGIWEWNREQILLDPALTLTDLLQHISAIAPYRAGFLLQPEVASGFGHTRGRVQVLLDGYEFDPLLEATPDFSRIALAQLEHIRVERRLDLTRVELTSLEPTDGRPHSRIDAGVGEPDTNLFRGVFLSPKFLIGPVGFTIERVDGDGFRGREPGDMLSTWAKLAFIRGSVGIQAELRQSAHDRAPASPWAAEAKRQDLILRARAGLLPGLVGEVFAGRSTFESDTSFRASTDTSHVAVPDAEVLQFGARASYGTQLGWADAALRFRDHEALPAVQLDASAGVRLGSYATLLADVSNIDWRGAGSALSYDLRAQTSTFSGVHGFAEIAGGKRGAQSVQFRTADSAFISEFSGQRIGAGFERWGGSVSAALLLIDSDSSQSFGLPFDSTDQRFHGADATGWEITWQVPLFMRGLSAHGYYTNYPSGILPLYLPGQVWRAALQYHHSPLRSGNLELYGRIEWRRRGGVFAPVRIVNGAASSWDLETLPSYDQIDGYFQIRIMDVRIFFRSENMANQEIAELPGRTIIGPRIFYGIRWQFWN